jgi:hypothetical protein
MDKDINEKTRVSLGLPSLFTIVGSTISLVIAIIVASWSIHSSLSDSKIAQQRIDNEQNIKHEIVNDRVTNLESNVKEGFSGMNTKIDLLIANSITKNNKDNEVRIYYVNKNKPIIHE